MADVQKSAFSLSSATIMIGKAFVDDVFALMPSTHSVGMVSEVNVGLDSQITELLNGVQQVTVDAKRTGVSGSITGNVYEFTAQNFMRSQAMAGTATAIKRGALSAAANAAAVSLSLNSDPVPGEATSAITAVGDIPSGSTLLLQRVGAETDYVFPTKSTGAATGTGPYTVPIAAPNAIPTGMSFPIGTKVWVVSPVGVANIDADDVFCVKIAGTLTQFDRPVVYIAPKVRMVRGFQISYNETAYGSMPWEMKPLLMSVTEAASMSRLSEIGTRQTGMLYVGG
jgi:hypothetical protein